MIVSYSEEECATIANFFNSIPTQVAKASVPIMYFYFVEIAASFLLTNITLLFIK